MKFDPQKTYPYPVLRPYSDDYPDCDIQTNVEFVATENEEKALCNVEFVTSSEVILDLIQNNKAAFVVNVCCRSTFFRETFRSFDNVFSIELELSMIRDEVRVEPYVVVVNDDVLLASDEINNEFGKGQFSLHKGHLLAQDEHQIFYVDRDFFKPVTSVFELAVDENLSEFDWRASCEHDHVRINLNPKMKKKIDGARNDQKNQAILINSIYFVAVVHAIQCLKDNPAEYSELKWTKIILAQLHNLGMELKSHDAYIIASALMRNPLQLLSTYVFKGEDI